MRSKPDAAHNRRYLCDERHYLSLIVSQATLAGLLLSLAGAPLALAQIVKDPPWNPEHIDGLPQEVRSAVFAKCASRPNAAHYFATYSHDSQQINLHFEKFHCDQKATFCNTSGCLHQTYVLSRGHYTLVKSFYGPDND